MPNRLSDATSPYLLQHQDNPVDWYEWCDEAFAEAERRDVPVILSIGYATCHWCHVMAHESFEDDDTASFMNEHFVSIKVDREERPDVDRIYMDVVTATTGRGGWPMTVFLTPKQKPIFAGTYFPRETMGQHPSFTNVMTAVLDAWNSNRQGVLQQADDIAATIASAGNDQAPLPGIRDIEQAVERMSASFDRVNGGFGTAPKFPQAPALELLLRTAALLPGTAAAKQSLDMLTLQLTAMAQGGIYDHLLGGFARYSVDAQWIVPHFEKMLYDNAQLARVYLRAWQLTEVHLFRDVAIEVLDYLDIAMADDHGGLHSAEDADSEGVEGRFAVWSWDELGSVLGEDRNLAAAIYGATPEGNFEGMNILHRFVGLADISAATGLDVSTIEERKRSIDDRLRLVRAQRTPPGRDDKIVTAWNGLAMRAFAEAGIILQEPRYVSRAEAIARFLLGEASPDGDLVRSWRNRPGHVAFADDHASLAIGLYTLYQVTGHEAWYEAAETHVEHLRAGFADPKGGFFGTSQSVDPLIARPKNTQDNPTPSDNALAMEALLLHAAYTADTEAITESGRTMQLLARDAVDHPTFGGYGLAIWLTNLVGIYEVAIVGGDGDRSSMERVVWERFRPDVVMASSGGADSAIPLLASRSEETASLAYVCRQLVCELPVDSVEGLRAKLLLETGTRASA
ncbi:MAG: thioredoxin domain-containing protein [Acidimicrobiia bacterium]|nr:MAG: thioredoxin domain-containing protein [Acidimicrobiia bacterium]